MRTRKKEKKEKRRRTRFAKGTKERKQRDNQKYAPTKEKTAMKKEEKKKTNKKWYIRKIMKKIFRVDLGWPGRTERGALPVTSHMFFVAICLLRIPTCTAALPIYLNSLNSRSLVELPILNPLPWVLVLKNL